MGMSEEGGPKNWLSSAGITAAGLGGFVLLLEMILGTDSGYGSACCCFGIFGMIAGGIVSSAGSAVSSNGKMVLRQDKTGQWNWVADQGVEIPEVVNAATQYNDQNTQIMSRVISEVRNGKSLEELDSNELNIIASAYGVDSGSDSQKIEALHNSDMAKKAMKLGAIGVGAGVGAVGAAKIIASGRERAAQRAEELREQGRAKLQENIEAGKYNINSKLPKSESGESATDVASNIVLDQLKVQIESRGLTPEKLIQMSDANNDGRLDAVEIATAMTQATGFAVPVFIVQDAMKEFDVNDDGNLDINELHLLWNQLGLSEPEAPETMTSDEAEELPVESTEESDNLQEDDTSIDDEIEAVLEEVSQTEEVIEIESQEIVEPETEVALVEGELTDGIDTQFERFVVEMEGAKFSSERKTLMENQTNEFLINMRIEKMERTLIGDPKYRSGQSVHALIDGGPYVGIVKIPVELDEEILQHKEGHEIKVMAKLVDFSPSLKRPVLEASKIL